MTFNAFDAAEKGYTYNDDREWWERTWTTNNGKESIIEVFQFKGGQWKQLMIGYGDRIFYEETHLSEKVS